MHLPQLPKLWEPHCARARSVLSSRHPVIFALGDAHIGSGYSHTRANYPTYNAYPYIRPKARCICQPEPWGSPTYQVGFKRACRRAFNDSEV